MSEEQSNLLAKEFLKWKNYEQNIINAIKNYKYNTKQREDLSKGLESKIANLNQTKCNLTQEVTFEMCNKFNLTNNILQLGEVSNQTNSVCDDIQVLLGICTTLKQKNKYILESIKTKLLPRIPANKNILKSQNDKIANTKNNTSSCNISINSFGLDALRHMQKKIIDDFNLILHDNEILERGIIRTEEVDTIEKEMEEITSTLLQKEQVIKSIVSEIENKNVKSVEHLTDLKDDISNMQKRFEDVNLNIEESKKILKEQKSIGTDFSKENNILKFESKCHSQKCSTIEKLLTEEKDRYLCDYTALQNNIELLNCNLQNEESILLKTKNVQQATASNMERVYMDVNEQTMQRRLIEQRLNNTSAKIVELIKLNDQESYLIDSLCQSNLERNNYIESVKMNINELKIKMLNITSNHKNMSEKLKNEIMTIKVHVDTRKEAIKAKKSEQQIYFEKCQLEESTMFNEKKSKLENQMEKIKESKDTVSDQIRQISIKLERSTLEVDILSRKIKSATELLGSLEKELQSKPQKLSNVKLQTKRQIDDTSDSSFDDTIPFHQRLLMNNKIKRSKPQHSRFNY